VTTLRLTGDPGLARVIDEAAHRVDGRVVVPQLEGSGIAVVCEQLRSRKRR
jgi:uncharacterized protein with von Willebrand factor type A (vWA) domain